MNLRLFATILALSGGPSSPPSSPASLGEGLDNMTSEPATHTAFTFDKDMLQSAAGLFGDQSDRDRRCAQQHSPSKTSATASPRSTCPESMSQLVAA